ncbi:MAG: hypothetical protein ACLP04_09845 [Solirubrobacteraceae bacterium]
MHDQGIPIGEGFELDCGARVTVPAMIVDWLRSAAYAEIGSAAESLDTVAFSRDREARPEWFRGLAESLKQTYALLDAIGWGKSVPPDAVQLDLREDYCWALMRALQGAAELADDDDASQAACGDVEQRGLALVHDLEARRVGVLWDFIADARARIDELAVAEGEGEGFVLDIAA